MPLDNNMSHDHMFRTTDPFWDVQLTKYIFPSAFMTNGKSTSEAVRWIVIRLSTAMTEEDIAMYTDICPRTVRKILSYFKKTGTVEGAKEPRPTLHKALCDYDIEV